MVGPNEITSTDVLQIANALAVATGSRIMSQEYAKEIWMQYLKKAGYATVREKNTMTVTGTRMEGNEVTVIKQG